MRQMSNGCAKIAHRQQSQRTPHQKSTQYARHLRISRLFSPCANSSIWCQIFDKQWNAGCICLKTQFRSTSITESTSGPTTIVHQNTAIKVLVQGTEITGCIVESGSRVNVINKATRSSLGIRSCRGVFAWSHEDMNGLDSKFYQHQINLATDAKPVQQRRDGMNPNYAETRIMRHA